MTRKKASAEDKAAARELLGDLTPTPQALFDQRIKDLIDEGAKVGIQVEVSLRHTEPLEDPWITSKDMRGKSIGTGTAFPPSPVEGNLFVLHEIDRMGSPRSVLHAYNDGVWRAMRPQQVKSGGMTMEFDPEMQVWGPKRPGA